MIVKDYYFKEQLRSCTKLDMTSLEEYKDLEEFQPVIRIVGTQDEIKKLANKYINDNKLTFYLDEVYTYEVPKKDTSWYKHPCFGTPEQYDKKMKVIQSNINIYKEKYEQQGAFIV